MNEKLTHYRKAFTSLYLSSADIDQPTILTIKHVKLEPDKSKKQNKPFNTAYFVEKEIRPGDELKPMILNVHNSKIVACMTNSKYIEHWNNVRVTVYVDPKVSMMGDIVEGLKFYSEAPPERLKLTPKMKQWDSAVLAYKRDKNFIEIEKRIDVSDENKKLIVEAANVL